MLLRDVMTPNVEQVAPQMTLQEAAQRMKSLDVGSLPVCENDKLVGMLTDRDIAIRAVAQGEDPRRCRVSDAMTSDVIYCFDDEDVERAAQIMEDRQIRRLIVMNHDHHAVGIVSLGDIATRQGNDRLKGETLEKISEPGSANVQSAAPRSSPGARRPH